LLNTDWFRTDLKQAVRALRRRPGSSAVAILTLAVGLGVNTVVFSAINALVFRPLDRAGADQAGWLFAGPRTQPLETVPLPLFEAIERNARTLEAVAAEGRTPIAYGRLAEVRQIWGLLVSPAYFAVIPPEIILGRPLSEDDARDPDLAVVVSERFWRRHLEANRALPALSVTLSGKPARVVGVMREGFQGPGGLFEPDVWAPLAARRALGLSVEYDDAKTPWLTMVARVRDGVMPAAVAVDVLPIVKEFRGGDAAVAQVQFHRLADGHPEARALRPVAALGLAAVAVVLLIACFNVAGLLLARSAERQGELGVRAAMGASRGRLIRQLLTEGLVLSGLAGSLALLLAHWSASLLSTFSLPAPIPQRLHFATDARLVAFAIVLSLVAAVVPAIAPAWHLWKTDVARLVRGSAQGSVGGRPQARARRVFLLVQVAGSTVFLIAAVIFGRSFVASSARDVGFNVKNTAVMIVDPGHYGYDASRARELVEELTRRLERRPDVASAGFADRVPFYVGYPKNLRVVTAAVPCEGSACPSAELFSVDPRYFTAMEIPLRLGRWFDPHSAQDKDAVIISMAAAEKWWPGQNPVGQSFRDGARSARERVVIGVVTDASVRSLSGGLPSPTIFQPVSATTFEEPVTIVVRARAAATDLLGPMREALNNIAPGLPPQSIETMEQKLALPLWPVRTLAGFFGLCGGLAVLLASVRLFGVTHLVVAQRTREFGVRLTLGASSADLRSLVIVEALRLVGPGIAIGGLLGGALGVVTGSRMMGIESAGPAVLIGTLVLQTAIVVAASCYPAWRASKVNPLVALRAE
jgi:predicted permease